MRFSLIICLLCLSIPKEGYPQQPDSLYLLSIEELLGIKVGIGSRADAKPQFSKLVSVDVISADELQSTGYTDLGMAIHSLLPYTQYYRPTLMDGADHIFPLSFRGFAADQLLVLINGKRLIQTAMIFENSRINKGASAIDFRAIPINAVERIEVLKEGASAQYGSDAIAGIINIILTQKSSVNANIRQGITYNGDGQTKEFLTGFGRSFKQGSVQIFANFHDRDFIDRAGLDERPQYFEGSPLNNGLPVKNQQYGVAASNDINITALTNFELDSKTKFYSTFLFNNRLGQSPGYFRRPLDNRTVRAIYPDGFLPYIEPTVQNISLHAGLTTEIAKWQVDFSMQYSKNAMDFYVTNSLNTSMGLRSPLSFYCGKLQLQDIITNANLNRSYSIGTYGPLTFSIGSETKFENYSVKKGDENSYSHGGELVLDGPNIGAATTPGAQVFPGFSPTNEIYRNRQNAALYVDVENQPFSKLTFGIASRVEQYSDFGTALNGKASIRIEPYKWLAIRGSLSTGFRAPSLAQSFYSSTVTNFIGGLPYENGTFNVEHPISRALGATNLKPEESTHYSAGFSLQTLPNLIINSDWYLVYVHNRIFFTGNFTASNAPSFAPLFSSYGIGGARFFTNAVSTVTQGIDFSVKHTGKLNSKFIVNTNFTLNFNRVLLQDKINIPSQISSYADVFFDRSEMARITQSQPELRVIGRVKIHSKSYSFTLSGLYYGPITVVHNIVKPETDQKITNGTVVDAFVTYNFPKGLSISIGCNNLFNKYPEKSMVQEGDFFTGKIFPYHQFSAYGFTGGSIFISLSYDFSL